MKMGFKVLVLIVCVSWGMQAQATRFNYNFFEFGYSKVSIDQDIVGAPDIDGNTLFLGGAFKINNHVSVLAAYRGVNLDFDLDYDNFEIGGGFHRSLTQRTDVYFDATLVDSRVSTQTATRSDDTGNSLKAGLRYSNNPNVELNLFAGRLDLFDDTENSYGIGTRIKFGYDRSFGIKYTRGDDSTDIEISFRMEM